MRVSNEKLTIEFVREEFKKGGCELVSLEYINARTPLKYICECGEVAHIRYDNFRQGKRCRECGNRKSAEIRRAHIDDVKKYFENRGCYLLEEEYINTRTPMKYICECGNISRIRFGNFKEGQRCGECRIYKISGINSPHYKPELTYEQRLLRRNFPENREWRKRVFERDDYTCDKCLRRGGDLHAHHIFSYDAYEELRTDVDNGATLCGGCHKNFHDIYGYGNNNLEQYKEWIDNADD